MKQVMYVTIEAVCLLSKAFGVMIVLTPAVTVSNYKIIVVIKYLCYAHNVRSTSLHGTDFRLGRLSETCRYEQHRKIEIFLFK